MEEVRPDLERQQANLIDAITQYGLTAPFRKRLEAIDRELDRVGELLLTSSASFKSDVTMEELDNFLDSKLSDIASVLKSDPIRAKQEAQNRIKELWMQPIDTPHGPAFRVTGDMLLVSPKEVMLNSSLMNN